MATHSLGLDHRIGFRQAKIIYNSNNRNTRKIIEGALISLNNTFVNNKSSTQEGEYVNAAICKNAKLKDFYNVAATLRTAASPLFSQVSVRSQEGSPHGTGTYGVRSRQVPLPEPPDVARVANNDHIQRPIRRSARIRNLQPP